MLHHQTGEAVGPAEVVHDPFQKFGRVGDIRSTPDSSGQVCPDGLALDLVELLAVPVCGFAGSALPLVVVLGAGNSRECLKRLGLFAYLALPVFVFWLLGFAHLATYPVV